MVLTNSLRPRHSAQDSITGDFLTGTGDSESAQFLQEGKSAFAKQDWPKAIEAFKQALAADPNQPEAHAYMGFILVQAGHADGALLAFEKALSQAPNFPMALWGKGMVLLRDKQDYSGARQVLEKLAQLLPAGAERSEVEKAIREMPAPEGKPRPQATAAAPSGQQIVGRISIDPKLKGNVDSQATLFIIARVRRRQRPSTGSQEDRSSGFSALLLPRARKRNDAGYAFHRPCHDYGPLGQRW